MARIDYPRVMGHRGAAAEAPENTLVSIRKVAEAGVPWVEIDAMLTGDDVPVLFHDDTLDRTTGRTGLMAETTFAEVQGLDAGRWFGPAFAGEPLPSLDDAVALICALGLGLNLEIKPSEGRDEVTAARVIDRLEAIWPKNGPPLLISSFQVACLEVAQARHPAWPRALVTTEPAAFDPGLMARLDCVAYHSYHEPMTAALAEAVRSSGYALACYTVNEVAEAERLFSLGVDCVITDYPGLMQRAFG
jgi:glycerophosphoryl diester phosphodiesterase